MLKVTSMEPASLNLMKQRAEELLEQPADIVRIPVAEECGGFIELDIAVVHPQLHVFQLGLVDVLHQRDALDIFEHAAKITGGDAQMVGHLSLSDGLSVI